MIVLKSSASNQEVSFIPTRISDANYLFITNETTNVETSHKINCKKKSFFSTFKMIFDLEEGHFYSFKIKYYGVINNKLDYQNVNNILGEILRSRLNYLKKHNKTVMDDTIYREFQINCLGKALDPMRYAFVDMQTKLSQGKRIKYRYNPRTDFDIKLPDYIFDNTSGNLIKNPKLQTIKNYNSSEDSTESTVSTEQSDSENSVSTKPPMIARAIFKKEDSETKYPFLNSDYTSEFI